MPEAKIPKIMISVASVTANVAAKNGRIAANSAATIAAAIARALPAWGDRAFGIAAVATLVHDAILTMGFFALTRIDFNLQSIAAILARNRSFIRAQLMGEAEESLPSKP